MYWKNNTQWSAMETEIVNKLGSTWSHRGLCPTEETKNSSRWKHQISVDQINIWNRYNWFSILWVLTGTHSITPFNCVVFFCTFLGIHHRLLMETWIDSHFLWFSGKWVKICSIDLCSICHVDYRCSSYLPVFFISASAEESNMHQPPDV